MSYKVLINGYNVETETLAELTQLIGQVEEEKRRFSKSEQREVVPIVATPTVERVEKKVRGPYAKKTEDRKRDLNWTREQLEEVCDNIENRERLIRYMPHTVADIKKKISIFKKRKTGQMSKLALEVNAEWNGKKNFFKNKRKTEKIQANSTQPMGIINDAVDTTLKNEWNHHYEVTN